MGANLAKSQGKKGDEKPGAERGGRKGTRTVSDELFATDCPENGPRGRVPFPFPPASRDYLGCGAWASSRLRSQHRRSSSLRRNADSRVSQGTGGAFSAGCPTAKPVRGTSCS